MKWLSGTLFVCAWSGTMLTVAFLVRPVTIEKVTPDHGAEVAATIKAAYVELDAPEWVGSGVVVKYGGSEYVVTAKHVVEDLTEINVIKREDAQVHTVIGDVIYRDENHDLALVRPRAHVWGSAAAIMEPVEFCSGCEAWYCGTPGRLHAGIDKTIVNATCVERDGRRLFGVNGNGWYGTSGGGVWVMSNGRPYLVGIAVELAWVDARAPILCEGSAAVRRCLEKGTD